MKYKVLLTAFFLSAVCVLSATAQTGDAKAVNKGVVNGSAISLPKPVFPPTAMAVGASGAVNVEVTIDEEGNVISATAISGHPLLRATSVEAAQKAKFKPVMINGNATKVSGIIVYNFAGSNDSYGKISWKQIGYEMGLEENSSTISFKFPASSIYMSIPADWHAERIEVSKLQTKIFTIRTGSEQTIVTIASGSANVPPTKLDVATMDHRQVLSGLKTAFESRLAADPVQLWNFKMGMVTGKASSHFADDNALRSFISEVQLLAANAPAGVALPSEMINDLLGKMSFTAADRTNIRNLIDKLRADQ